jgi:hypothetical protein
VAARAGWEYERANENIRVLIDVRFRLRAFLPVFGGVAIFLLSVLGLSGPESARLAPSIVVAAVSVLAFLATLGIVASDQRNSELYNALIHRAKYLESLFAAPVSPGTLRATKTGGQCNERALPQKKLSQTSRTIQAGPVAERESARPSSAAQTDRSCNAQMRENSESPGAPPDASLSP